jgi:malonate-semialdehyde dehydrogenase (acetylating)/methylmalonate-semialdehyde dehydrogenase
MDRVQYLFQLKMLLEQSFEEISRIITKECDKTLAESWGEMHRAIENVGMACAAAARAKGYNTEDIAAASTTSRCGSPWASAPASPRLILRA